MINMLHRSMESFIMEYLLFGFVSFAVLIGSVMAASYRRWFKMGIRKAGPHIGR